MAAAPFGTVALHGTVQLRQVGGTWRVAWTPAALDAALGAGRRIERRTTWPARGQVLGAGGVSLTPPGVSVGLVGGRITDPAEVGSLLGAAGFPAATVSAALARAAAAPTQLVPVGVLPEDTYRALKSQPGTTLYSVAGTAFSAGAQAPLTADLGAHLVGTVGPITAEELAHLGSPYTATSQVGQGGIEAGQERTLAGSPAATAVVVDRSGRTVATLASVPAQPGQDVRTSIDPAVQRAAEAALDRLPATAQAALVVERASTGEVLASVSRPRDTPFDLALDGQVPPGSTFKVVTASDLLEHGASPATPATCPPTVTVDGQAFRNFEGEAAGTISLARAFAISCNTAFIGLSAGLPAASWPQVAAQYGLGEAVHAGVPVAATSVPVPTSANAQAATSIGQAAVVVSPLAMATLAATAGSGALHLPRIVAGSPDDSAPAVALPAGIAAAVQQLMAGVVTGGGTAAGAGLPPGTIGKTGTAEFGSGPHPPTDAWFVGVRGDVAVSVLVVGGGVGGVVAAPLAAPVLGTPPTGGG